MTDRIDTERLEDAEEPLDAQAAALLQIDASDLPGAFLGEPMLVAQVGDAAAVVNDRLRRAEDKRRATRHEKELEIRAVFEAEKRKAPNADVVAGMVDSTPEVIAATEEVFRLKLAADRLAALQRAQDRKDKALQYFGRVEAASGHVPEIRQRFDASAQAAREAVQRRRKTRSLEDE